jgi:hypothetical protein
MIPLAHSHKDRMQGLDTNRMRWDSREKRDRKGDDGQDRIEGNRQDARIAQQATGMCSILQACMVSHPAYMVQELYLYTMMVENCLVVPSTTTVTTCPVWLVGQAHLALYKWLSGVIAGVVYM